MLVSAAVIKISLIYITTKLDVCSWLNQNQTLTQSWQFSWALVLTSGPGGPGGPCGPGSPVFPFQRENITINIIYIHQKRSYFSLSSADFLVHWQSIAFVLNTEGLTRGPGFPRGPVGPGLPAVPWKRDRNKTQVSSLSAYSPHSSPTHLHT